MGSLFDKTVQNACFDSSVSPPTVPLLSTNAAVPERVQDTPFSRINRLVPSVRRGIHATMKRGWQIEDSTYNLVYEPEYLIDQSDT